jgi:hypothetical protein
MTKIDNTDAHFLNRNYGRTGRADGQTDQQHSTSRANGSTFEFLFEFQTEFFSNFLFEFQDVRASNRSTIEGPL